MHILTLQFFTLFLAFAGFIIGLGAVTIIDMLGFLGRKSAYWTEATIRSHKVTKPLIWLGIALIIIAEIFRPDGNFINATFQLRYALLAILVLNGLFLSFWVSPQLLEREQQGKSTEILPSRLQSWITVSFLISFLCWWSSVIIFVWQIYQYFPR